MNALPPLDETRTAPAAGATRTKKKPRRRLWRWGLLALLIAAPSLAARQRKKNPLWVLGAAAAHAHCIHCDTEPRNRNPRNGTRIPSDLVLIIECYHCHVNQEDHT